MNPVAQSAGPAEITIFVILAAASIAGALFTISSRNPVTAVMSLVGTFFALAGIYATMSAHFLAILQIAVYAGAIMVLFIFVVMILNREDVTPVSFRGIGTRLLGIFAGGYITYIGASIVWKERSSAVLAGPAATPPAEFGTVSQVGMSLFRDFVFPFEAISLLLLVAIVGGIIVSRSSAQEERALETARKLREIRQLGHEPTALLPGASSDAHDPGAHHAHH